MTQPCQPPSEGLSCPAGHTCVRTGRPRMGTQARKVMREPELDRKGERSREASAPSRQRPQGLSQEGEAPPSPSWREEVQ